MNLKLCIYLFFFSLMPWMGSKGVAQEGSAKSLGSVHLEVDKFKLENGLTVLMHVDRSSPLISYHTWFKVGSRNEEPGHTGMAHLFEHMMFKGAKRYDGKAFDKILGSNGAVNNAFTTRDATAYYAILPSHKLEIIVDLESDRMENLEITEAHLKSEREVVKEERRFRVDNQPHGMLNEGVFSTLFRVYPYRWPVIGWMEDLNRITVAKCKEFFKTHYSPNNATVVISGDFSVFEAKRLVNKYYGSIKGQKIPPKIFPEEPVQRGQREHRIARKVQNEHIAIAFKTVPSHSKDIYALEVLAGMLGGGESSRLYKRIVYDSQIASSVGAEHSSMVGPGVFTIYMSLKPNASHDQALNLAYNVLWDARNKLFTDKELLIAKNQILRQHVDSLKTVNGKAQALAYNEVLFGGYENLFKDLENYKAVTLEEVRKVGSKYLKPEQRNLIVLNNFQTTQLPEETGGAPKSDETPSGVTNEQ